MNKKKLETLKGHGCLNPNPGKVKDEMFLRYDFFDPNDMLQVKYEMLRRKRVDNWTTTKACVIFGFSRPSFYEIQAAFEQDGIEGLLPGKRGPNCVSRRSMP